MVKNRSVVSLTEPRYLTQADLTIGRAAESRRDRSSSLTHIGKLPPYNILASILTDSFNTNVSEFTLTEPFATTVTPCRPSFTMLIAKSSTSLIEFRCESEGGHADTREKILFMAAGKEVGFHYSPGTYRAVCCSFESDYADRFLESFTQMAASSLIPALDMKNALISCILLRLMNEALNPGPISNIIAESLGNTLLAECAHQLLSCGNHQQPEGRLLPQHIQIIERYLSGPLLKAPTVSELAAACQYSERHFAKLFHDQYGYSVSKYIKSAQIARAKVYLCETNLHLKEVAHRLGFSSVSHFSQGFRDATGYTPGQFRREESSNACRTPTNSSGLASRALNGHPAS